MPTFLQDALREGGLFAVAVVCLAVTSVFYRMWRSERDINQGVMKAGQDGAATQSKSNADLASALNRLADGFNRVADEVQRTREEQLRYRLEHQDGDT